MCGTDRHLIQEGISTVCVDCYESELGLSEKVVQWMGEMGYD